MKQFLAALVNFLVLALGFLALKMGGIVNYDTYWTLAMLFGASLLQVLCYPLVYIMERVFNLVSTSRLLELEDMSNFLLKDLEQNAPGTFQHSLQVMNLASAAARAIGADEALVKAGALYHDIGKTMNPLCYVENESIGSELAAECAGDYQARYRRNGIGAYAQAAGSGFGFHPFPPRHQLRDLFL